MKIKIHAVMCGHHEDSGDEGALMLFTAGETDAQMVAAVHEYFTPYENPTEVPTTWEALGDLIDPFAWWVSEEREIEITQDQWVEAIQRDHEAGL